MQLAAPYGATISADRSHPSDTYAHIDNQALGGVLYYRVRPAEPDASSEDFAQYDLISLLPVSCHALLLPRRSHLSHLVGLTPSKQFFAGQLRCLPYPARHELLVELVILVDVEVAHVILLGLHRGIGRNDEPCKKVTLMYFVKQW